MFAASYAISLSVFALVFGLALALVVDLALSGARLAREAASGGRPLIVPLGDGTPREARS